MNEEDFPFEGVDPVDKLLNDIELAVEDVKSYTRRSTTGKVYTVKGYVRTDNSAVADRAKSSPGRPGIAAGSGRFAGDRSIPVWADAGKKSQDQQELDDSEPEYKNLEDTGVVDQAVLDKEVPIALKILPSLPMNPALKQLISILKGLTSAGVELSADIATDLSTVELAMGQVHVSGYSYINKNGNLVRVNPYTRWQMLINALGGPNMAAKKGITAQLLRDALPGDIGAKVFEEVPKPKRVKPNKYTNHNKKKKQLPHTPSTSAPGRISNADAMRMANKIDAPRQIHLPTPNPGDDYMKKAMGSAHPLAAVREALPGSVVSRGKETWTRGVDDLWHKTPRRNEKGLDDKAFTRKLASKGGVIDFTPGDPLPRTAYPLSRVNYDLLNPNSKNYGDAVKYSKSLEPAISNMPEGIADSLNGHLKVEAARSGSKSYTRMSYIRTSKVTDHYPELVVHPDAAYEKDLLTSLPGQQREGFNVPSTLHPLETMMTRESASFIESLFNNRAPEAMSDRMYDRLSAAYDKNVKIDKGDYSTLRGRDGWVARTADIAADKDLKKHLSENLSRSAVISPEDFLAEAWTEYVGNPTPRPLARDIGKAMKLSMEEFNDYLYNNQWADASDIPAKTYKKSARKSLSRSISDVVDGHEDHTVVSYNGSRDMRSILNSSATFADVRDKDGNPLFNVYIEQDGSSAHISGLEYPLVDPLTMPSGGLKKMDPIPDFKPINVPDEVPMPEVKTEAAKPDVTPAEKKSTITLEDLWGTLTPPSVERAAQLDSVSAQDREAAKRALSMQTEGAARDFNDALRNPKLVEWGEVDKQQLDSFVHDMDLNFTDPLAEHLPSKTVLWRGTSAQSFNPTPGDSFTDPAFISTSVDRRVAEKFDGRDFESKGFLLKIIADQGTPFQAGSDPQSKELVLPRNTKMDVVSVEPDPSNSNISVVTMHIPGPSGDSNLDLPPEVVYAESSTPREPLSVDVQNGLRSAFWKRFYGSHYVGADSLSDEEYASYTAFKKYISLDAEALNANIRKYDELSATDKAATDKFVSAMDANFTGPHSQEMPSDTVLWRGVSNTGEASPQPGEIISDPAYLSSSFDQATAKNFSLNAKNGEDNGFVYEIQVDKGTKFVPGFDLEKEAILPRNTKLEVIKSIPDPSNPKRTLVTLKALPEGTVVPSVIPPEVSDVPEGMRRVHPLIKMILKERAAKVPGAYGVPEGYVFKITEPTTKIKPLKTKLEDFQELDVTTWDTAEETFNGKHPDFGNDPNLDSITRQELAGVQAREMFTSSDGFVFNKMLRENPVEAQKKLSGFFLDNMDYNFRREDVPRTTGPTEAWRGIGSMPYTFDPQPGDILTDPAFTSLTWDKETGVDWARDTPSIGKDGKPQAGTPGTLIRVLMEEGVPWIPGQSSLGEMILNRNTPMQVLDIEDQGEGKPRLMTVRVLNEKPEIIDPPRYLEDPLEKLTAVNRMASRTRYADYIDNETALKSITATEETLKKNGIDKVTVNTQQGVDSVLYARAGYKFDPKTTDVADITSIIDDVQDMLDSTYGDRADGYFTIPKGEAQKIQTQLNKWKKDLTFEPETWPTPQEIADLGKMQLTKRSLGEEVLNTHSWDGTKTINGPEAPVSPKDITRTDIARAARSLNGTDTTLDGVTALANKVALRSDFKDAKATVSGDSNTHTIKVTSKKGDTLFSIDATRNPDGTVSWDNQESWNTKKGALLAFDMRDQMEIAYKNAGITGIKEPAADNDPVGNYSMAMQGYDWTDKPDPKVLEKAVFKALDKQVADAKKVLTDAALRNPSETSTAELVAAQHKADKKADELKDRLTREANAVLAKPDVMPLEIAQLGKDEYYKLNQERLNSPNPTPDPNAQGFIPTNSARLPDLDMSKLTPEEVQKILSPAEQILMVKEQRWEVPVGTSLYSRLALAQYEAKHPGKVFNSPEPEFDFNSSADYFNKVHPEAGYKAPKVFDNITTGSTYHAPSDFQMLNEKDMRRIYGPIEDAIDEQKLWPAKEPSGIASMMDFDGDPLHDSWGEFMGKQSLTFGGYAWLKTWEGYWNWATDINNSSARKESINFLYMLLRLMPAGVMRGSFLQMVTRLNRKMGSSDPGDWPTQQDIEDLTEKISAQIGEKE